MNDYAPHEPMTRGAIAEVVLIGLAFVIALGFFFYAAAVALAADDYAPFCTPDECERIIEEMGL